MGRRPGTIMSTPQRVPTNRAFLAEVGRIMCLQAGDSWVADDGAQDQYMSDALETIKAINAVLRRSPAPVEAPA